MREKLERAVSGARDGWLWAVTAIEKHPHRTLVLVLGLVLIGLKSCV